jgi:hypothetical protein
LGLYFNFVETYAQSLVILLALTLAGVLFNWGSNISSVILVFWSFGFILEWRRRQTTRAYNNGILDTIERGWEEARPEYFGHFGFKIFLKCINLLKAPLSRQKQRHNFKLFISISY